MRSEKKERQQKGAAQREGEGDSFPGRALQRELEDTILDTGKHRTSLKMRRSQKIRTYCQS